MMPLADSLKQISTVAALMMPLVDSLMQASNAVALMMPLAKSLIQASKVVALMKPLAAYMMQASEVAALIELCFSIAPNYQSIGDVYTKLDRSVLFRGPLYLICPSLTICYVTAGTFT